jgi:hypothetical protein
VTPQGAVQHVVSGLDSRSQACPTQLFAGLLERDHDQATQEPDPQKDKH